MDKNKHRNKGTTCKQGGKKCNNSKCNTKQKVGVYRHFDPSKKTTKSSQHENIPDFLVSEDDSFEKTKKSKSKRRTSSTGTSESSLRRSTSDNKRAAKRKSVSSDGSQAKISSNKIATQPTCYNSGLENRIQQNLDYVSNRGNMRMSVKDMRCRLQQKLKLDKSNPVHALKSLERAVSESSEATSKQCACVEDELYLQKLKREISRTRGPCSNNDIKKTVSELKSEIAKYRETLNKNVNFLQKRLGPKFFEKRGSTASEASKRVKATDAPLQADTSSTLAGRSVEVDTIKQNKETDIPERREFSDDSTEYQNFEAYRPIVKDDRVPSAVIRARESKPFDPVAEDIFEEYGSPIQITTKENKVRSFPIKLGSLEPVTDDSGEDSDALQFRESLNPPDEPTVPEPPQDFPSDFDEFGQIPSETPSAPTVTEEESVPDRFREDLEIDTAEQDVARVSKGGPDVPLGSELLQERSSQKIDRAVENPKHSLRSLPDQTAELEYLKRQKESIEKVDQLIEEAELSLKELRKEFYQNTFQELNDFTQKVSESGAADKPRRSIAEIAQTIAKKKSLEMTLNLYRTLNEDRAQSEDGIVRSSDAQIAAGQSEKKTESGRNSVKRSSLRKKKASDTKKTPSYTKRMTSDTKQTPSFTKRTASDTKETPSITKKMSSCTKEIPGEIVLAEECLDNVDGVQQYNADNLEVEVVSINFLPESATAVEGSDTEKSSQPTLSKRTVRVANSCQLRQFSVGSAESITAAAVPIQSDTEQISVSQTGVPLSVPVKLNRFLDVKNSVYLKVPSPSESEISDEDISQRGSVRISAIPTEEIEPDSSASGPLENEPLNAAIMENKLVENVPSDEINTKKESIQNVSSGNVKKESSGKIDMKKEFIQNVSSGKINIEKDSIHRKTETIDLNIPRIDKINKEKESVENISPTKEINKEELSDEGGMESDYSDLSPRLLPIEEEEALPQPTEPTQLSNIVKKSCPQVADMKVSKVPESSNVESCCLCPEDYAKLSVRLPSKLAEDCSCKMELEMLKNSPCCKALPSRLKSPCSPRKTPKKTSFCTNCQTIVPEEMEQKDLQGMYNAGFAEEPSQSSDVDTDDSYLNTISERTEPTSTAVSQERVPSKSKQLTVQHLPQISIKPPLVVQKVFEIEIKPTGSVQMQIPTIHNIRYEEILHAEDNEEIRSILIDIGNEDGYKIKDQGTSVNVMEPDINLEDYTNNLTPESSMNEILVQRTANYTDDVSHLLEINEDDIISSDDKPKTPTTSETQAASLDEKGAPLVADIKEDNLSASLESLKELKRSKSKSNSENSEILNISKGSIALKPSLKSIRSDNKPARTSASASILFRLASDLILSPVNNRDETMLQDAPAQPCGCREGSKHTTDDVGLILDENLDLKCECKEEPEVVAMLELKKSLHEVDDMEKELNQSLSVRLFQAEGEDTKKINFRLLDVEKDGNLDGQEEGTKEDDARKIRDSVASTNSEPRRSSNGIGTPPLKNISAMKNLKEGMSDNEIKDQETPESPKVERKEPVKYQKSERGTPLFTVDPNHPVATELPKSISEFFNEEDISTLDEDDEDDGKKEKEEVCYTSVPNQDTIKGNASKNLQGTDVLVTNVLNELDKDLGELDDHSQSKQIIAVNCECVCKKDTEKPKAVNRQKSASSNSTRNSNASKSSLKQKLKTKKRRRSDISDSLKKPSSDSFTCPLRTAPRPSLAVRKNSSSSSKSPPSPTTPYPPPALAQMMSISPDRSKPSSFLQSSQNNYSKKGGATIKQFSNKDIGDPNIKASLMGAFDLGKKTSPAYKRTSVSIAGSKQPSILDEPVTSQSEESVYVLTHDVSTQVSLESVMSERRQSGGSRTDKKAPRVTISINSEEPKVRETVNGYSKKNKKVASKDQNQQISEDNNGIITSPSSEDIPVEQTMITNIENANDAPQTVVLQPVMVYYESKGVQKSLEDWGHPPVKLHKLTTCNDMESTSTNETDYENRPCRNAACGDIPSSSEFLPINTARVLNRNYNVDEPGAPSGGPNLKIYRSPKYTYTSSSTDTTDSKLEESISEGEIKCRCSASAGEVHVCRLKNGSKVRTAYLKKHPETLLKQEFPSDNVQLLRQRKLYENWVTYYTSKTSSANSSDTNEVSTDT